MQKKLNIYFLSDWHISSGLGDGHRTDALLTRDHAMLPYIPGRAVKGALREGARRLALCTDKPYLKDAEKYFWGSAQDAEESNFSGVLRVSDARLPQAVYDALTMSSQEQDAHVENLIRDLTIIRQHTSLDDAGMVVEHSLHSIECGMAGICLEAELQIALDPHVEKAWAEQYFTAVCAAVRGIGGHRARGLGLCHVYFVGNNTTPTIPAQPAHPLRHVN